MGVPPKSPTKMTSINNSLALEEFSPTTTGGAFMNSPQKTLQKLDSKFFTKNETLPEED
jgi:hypothetical protein